MDKNSIRKTIRAYKKQYTDEELKLLSRHITDKLEKHKRFVNADCVLLYHSLTDEVQTHALIEKYKSEKKILLPTVVGNEIELHEYNASASFKKGPFDISESNGKLFEDYSMIDLAVIPGVAFDAHGNRLGRGKGYYDRLLPKLTCIKIGICFPFQFVSDIPCEAHDIPVNEVIY
ncbi:MAG: 5-formyltetrahydrofolate cyclo-ligase [Bacteroides sp.]|nr:5-formyltetrahydrofolate cyclo-ligase [Roseburia sp.]MCM1347489.1 5-formyltetrahydrofolate cyclo-ligase [Bacteroides sp.]MCM1421977.1 5-formyltetrahydrofolate cyclo-ligase [Bacteroides sp.]